MGCGGSKPIKSLPVAKFYSLMNLSASALTKYQYNKEVLVTLQKALSNPVYGGSALLPIGELGQKGRKKYTPLGDNITSYDQSIGLEKKEGEPVSHSVDLSRGGGFYELRNIKLSKDSNEYADIWILVQQVEDKDTLKLMQEISEVDPKTGLPLKVELLKTNKKKVYWDQLKDSLTGVARIIIFENKDTKFSDYDNEYKEVKCYNFDTKNLLFKSIVEGNFEKGLKNGYCRVIIPDATKDARVCQVGFFQEDLPQGKYVSFKFDGSIDEKEGIYENGKLSHAIKLAQFKEQIQTRNTIEMSNP